MPTGRRRLLIPNSRFLTSILRVVDPPPKHITLSTVGLTLDLAFQGLLANVIAGVQLLVEGHVHIGDEVSVDDGPRVRSQAYAPSRWGPAGA